MTSGDEPQDTRQPKGAEIKEAIDKLAFPPGRYRLTFEIDEHGAISKIGETRAVPNHPIEGWPW